MYKVDKHLNVHGNITQLHALSVCITMAYSMTNPN